MEAYLSLGNYEDVLNSDFLYWEVRKQLMDNGMEMTRLWRLYTCELRQRFDDEVESVKKSRPSGGTVHYSVFIKEYTTNPHPHIHDINVC